MSGKTLLLVDGHGLAFRAFYALPELNAPDGTPTNAILGFANMLVKTFEEVRPELAAVVFDAPGPTFRHEAYEAYKEGRQPTPEEFKRQLPFIKDFSGRMGLRVVERPGIEADDVIASTARSAAEQGIRVVILTADKDIFQVLAPGLSVMRPVRGVSEFRVYDEKIFEEEWGFPPGAMADYLAMVGDSVDNIPGIRGVGDKTARALLASYGSLEDIYEHLEDLKPALRKKMKEGHETAFSSRELTRLRFDGALETGELEIGPLERGPLREMFGRFAMKKLAGRILGDEKSEEEQDPLVVAGESSMLQEWGSIDELLQEEELAFSWSGRGNYPAGFSIGNICLCSKDGRYWTEEATPDLLEKLSYWAKTRYVLTSGYKEICAASPGLFPDPGKIWDSVLAHYVLHPELPPDPVPGPSFEDCSKLWRLRDEQEPLIRSMSLDKVMRDIDTPLCPVLAAMERHGIRVERNILGDLEEELDLKSGEISAEIDSMAGSHINLNSPKQVAWLLFEKMGFTPVKKNKTGYSTDVSVLEELAEISSSKATVPRMMLEYREITKIITGFIQPLLKGVDPVTGCVHTTLEHAFTGTGRLSSRDPNLQNLPSFGNLAGRLRSALRPRNKNNIFVAGDYSQVELRILAHICGEERLKDAFAQGRDIHSETALWIFGEGNGSVDPEQRRMAKVVNFGLLYGMSAHGLSARMGIGREEAASVIERYFKAFPKVRDYMENSAREARERGYTLTLFGRRRPLNEVSTIEGRGGGALGRVSVNTPLQGSAADIARIAMIRYSHLVEESGLEAPLVLQVHDSLVCECPRESVERVSVIMREAMEGSAVLSVPLEVHIKTGETFEEM
ncbi:MAG TPA: DNA polymerase [Synergistales bacterium]|nr:DNA polymerase [Synergistales bacterium]HRV71569.1 DNA polymerase [Thermovirgaceae bacterium]